MIVPDTNNSVFQLAADFVNQTSQHIFLTGKAGTGKTTFLKHIRNTTHKSCVVAAPTGVAAINAGGVTLHSLFQLPFEPFIPGTDFRNTKDRFKFSAAKREMLQQIELLIIDEVSMLRADTLDCIDAMLRFFRHNNRSPFGGVQMLYIGDMFQLPPVVKDNEWVFLRDYYPSLFFFHAKVVQQATPVYLELKKIYRQREQFFVDLLNRVRNNELTQDDFRALNRQYQPDFHPPVGEKYITLTTRNAKADEINNRELTRLVTPTYRFEGEIKGDFPSYSLPTDLILTLKKGAQIMFIKNDTGEERRYFNGKLGTIAYLEKDNIKVRLEGSGDVIEIEKEIWKNIRYTLNKETTEIEEEELGSFVQYPIRLAWAITIHKSQGLTFERAIIDTGDAFAAGQAYVALSRCTSLDGIVLLSQITQKSIQTDIHAVQLSKSEKEQAELQRLFEEEKKRFWAERLLLYFDCKDLIAIPRKFDKLLEDKTSEDYDSARKLVRNMLSQAYEIQKVAVKFQEQLKAIVRQQQSTDDLSLLTERCKKAMIYFHQTIVDGMLSPLQQYNQGFRIKKAKTFHKNLCALEQDLKLFMENMKKVRYNDVLLVKDLVLSFPERGENGKKGKMGEMGEMGEMGKAGEAKPETSNLKPETSNLKPETSNFKPKTSNFKPETSNFKPKTSNSKPDPRTPSAKQSYDLFREGLSVKKIAESRNISENTVASHLAEFVLTGELSVTDLIPQETVDALTPWIQAAIAEDNLRLTPIKEAVGERFSYSDIRFVLNHCLYQRNKK